jgi:hypothetical protein
MQANTLVNTALSAPDATATQLNELVSQVCGQACGLACKHMYGLSRSNPSAAVVQVGPCGLSRQHVRTCCSVVCCAYVSSL